MPLACLAFAPSAGAAEALVPSQAASCPQSQYHRGLRVEGAPSLEREVDAPVAVSRKLRSAISRAIPVQIDVSFLAQKCQSIVSLTASETEENLVVYSPLEVLADSHKKRETGQYQSPRVRYQPLAPEAVVTKSAQLPEPGHGETRLMIKIGLLLGVAYLAFLTLWFWATRGQAASDAGRSRH